MLPIDFRELYPEWKGNVGIVRKSMVVDQPLGFGHYCQFSEQLPTLIPVHFLTMKEQLRTRLQGLWQRQSCIKHKAALSVMIFAAGIVPSCLQVKHGGYKQKENLLLMAFSMMCDSSIYSSYIFGWGFFCVSRLPNEQKTRNIVLPVYVTTLSNWLIKLMSC